MNNETVEVWVKAENLQTNDVLLGQGCESVGSLWLVRREVPATEWEPGTLWADQEGEQYWLTNDGSADGETFRNDVGDEYAPSEMGDVRPLVVIDPAAVDWRGLQSQMSVLVVGSEPFKRAGDILDVVRRELGLDS